VQLIYIYYEVVLKVHQKQKKKEKSAKRKEKQLTTNMCTLHKASINSLTSLADKLSKQNALDQQ